jgi:small subunit ribosomal protein S1
MNSQSTGDILEKLVDEAQSSPQKESAQKTLNDTAVQTEDSPSASSGVSSKTRTSVRTSTEEEDTSPMGQLVKSHPIVVPEVGDVLQGTVVDVSSNSVLLDLGSFGTGVVLGKEIKDGLGTGKLKKGDIVNATLIDRENEDGYIELSIREASYEKAWDDLRRKMEQKEVVPTKIIDANKGGLMVELNGIMGFLPVSQLSSENYPRVEDGDKNKILELLKELVNKELDLCVIDVDQETEKLIVSERAAASDKEKEKVSSLNVGDIIQGEVSGVVDFGAFVKFSPKGMEDTPSNQLEGLVHISELAWQLIDDPRDIIKGGDKVQAKIIGIEDTRISLSMKALMKDPWSVVFDKYSVGDIVKGRVDKINHFGAFVYLDEDIHGLAHVSEFQERYPKKKLENVVSANNEYYWKILSIEPKSHRMGLVYIAEEEVEDEKKKVEEERAEAEQSKKQSEKPAKSTNSPKETEKSESA